LLLKLKPQVFFCCSFAPESSTAIIPLANSTHRLGGSTFDFYADTQDLEDGLEVSMLDSFYIESETSLTTLVQVSRGPQKYIYDPVKIYLKSGCEDPAITREKEGAYDKDILFNYVPQNDVNAKKIKFLTPCPEVEIAGDIERDGTFLINSTSGEVSDDHCSVGCHLTLACRYLILGFAVSGSHDIQPSLWQVGQIFQHEKRR